MSSEEHTVHCRKLNQQLPGLKRPPFKNELGQRIYNDVSKQAWDEWLRYSVRIINTLGIDLASEAGQKEMLHQTSVYFGYEEGELAPTAWTAPSASE